jgi:hypothetical protein
MRAASAVAPRGSDLRPRLPFTYDRTAAGGTESRAAPASRSAPSN